MPDCIVRCVKKDTKIRTAGQGRAVKGEGRRGWEEEVSSLPQHCGCLQVKCFCALLSRHHFASDSQCFWFWFGFSFSRSYSDSGSLYLCLCPITRPSLPPPTAVSGPHYYKPATGKQFYKLPTDKIKTNTTRRWR